VPVDSALGYLLGADDREGRTSPPAATWTRRRRELAGSWYRPDLDRPSATLPWTYLHHIDLQWAPAVAAWIAESCWTWRGPTPKATLSGWR
jgi:hypothetical protein